MHPLKFPNTGIRAKVFVRKIGFKLREMRLNHVELFYAFLLHFRSESSEERGRPTMSRPSTNVADHGQATYRECRPRPAPLQGRPIAVATASKRFHFTVHMNKFKVTLPKLLNMLREVESTIKKEKPVLYISETNKKRKASKTLKKGKSKERPSKTKVCKKEPIKDSASNATKTGTERGTIRITLQRR
ncbi:hypothetical protein GW17_00060600 [Ensete ventricosum]|nr:hypothetical protein GW17_00060600 [Ensete ventricosum]